MSALLTVEGVSKHFGGVRACNLAHLEVLDGETHALIGPNGAGKSTLIALLAGTLAPEHGRIVLRGEDVTRLPAHARVTHGLARSFQVTSVFPDFSLRDNILFSLLARDGSSFHFWRPVRAESALHAQADAILSEIGLAESANLRAKELAHGQQRQLEIGLALAAEPKLLLLDEPMAGMGVEDGESMLTLLTKIKPRVAMLLVEHDMDTVFRLADRISVLVAGEIIATGAPAEIRTNASVRAAYLGDADAA
jgi:branched-chain amino acid transport system ATP-binding protein